MNPHSTIRAVLLMLCWCAVAGDRIPSQAPTIIPLGGRFEGSVQGGIALLANEDRSSTRLYYTVSNCCNCPEWKKPDPAKTGIDQDTRELRSVAERIHLTKSGCITAVAVMEGQDPSELTTAVFEITDSLIAPPLIHPNRGKYRGRVAVRMASETPDVSIYYTIDGDAPTEQSDKYTGSFNLTAVGRHYIRAVAVAGGMRSPVSERVVEIVLPVKYAVVVDGCEECKGATVGRPFVLMFQGFKPSPVTRVFVSPLDCSTGLYHMLEGCDCRDGIIPYNLSLKLVTNDNPVDQVFVCFTENGGQTWSLIPNAATSQPHFTLHTPLDASGHHINTTAFFKSHQQEGLVEEATPADWETYHTAQRRKRASSQTNSDALTPGIVVLVILGTGLWYAFKRT
eukprot:TRINITY_DN34317_c0_g1_i1.p1 TRINITY_DN34317_c0_g1~~TRINITY_DN34317_c0_g1_i1.p1  ORF type:complete len:426 (+),score=42.05 TRINITY_DN34317_c0_g1_i1:93-1280(+)